MKKVYLVGRSGIYRNRELSVENEIIIGRDATVCQLVYPSNNREISSVHCKVQNINGNVQLKDMGSTNGTFLDTGVRLAPHISQVLQSGQSFYLADRGNSFAICIQDNTVSNPVSTQSGKMMINDTLSGTKAFSITALVLGIVGLVFLFTVVIPIITGTVGTVFGSYALYTKKRGWGMAIAGLICSIISIAMPLVIMLVELASL